jgi:hypothetical protein
MQSSTPYPAIAPTQFPLVEYRRAVDAGDENHAQWLSDLWSVALTFGRCRDFQAVREAFPLETWTAEHRGAVLAAWDDLPASWDRFVRAFGAPTNRKDTPP